MISKEQAPKENSKKLSTGQVEHIAKLAKIELTEEEKEKFSNELSSVLDYVDKLNQIDTKKVNPISQVTGLENKFRSDELKKAGQASGGKILEGAPVKKNGYFKVPKILE